ncbi:MAG: hypothetical protein ACYC5O_10320 [Anaerolineae bacterium]
MELALDGQERSPAEGLVLTIRCESYDDAFIGQLNAIQDDYRGSVPNMPGYVLVTSDFGLLS